jgi:negative regulator of sigma E activity
MVHKTIVTLLKTMSAPKEKDDAGPGPGTTIGPMCDDVSQEDLNVRIEQNHVEAQKRRNHSQLETANKLHALALQQQEQIRKLQEHASYNQLREISKNITPPSMLARSIHLTTMALL